jgi:hypothetical protein
MNKDEKIYKLIGSQSLSYLDKNKKVPIWLLC